jgi:hydrogenase nickel incorporation protein HypA/HybF
MHELSIAANILELAEDEAKQAGCQTITEIELEIGTLAGVELEALRFGFEAVSKGSMAQDAGLNIITTQAKAKCSGCGALFPVHSYFDPCPKCDFNLNSIEQGEELRMVAVNVE